MAIPFVNVSFIKNNVVKSSFCDENGLVIIEKASSYNQIEFSCIGYETFVINNTAILPNAIYLKQKVIELNEVIVTKNNNKILNIGYHDFKKKIAVGIGKGLEEVVFIENKFKKTLNVKSFLFNIKKIHNRTVFRVHFYKKLLNEFKPGEEILTEDIIQYLDNKAKGLIQIDVAHLGIQLPIDGAFVGIEALGIVDKNTGRFVENLDNQEYLKIEYNYELNKSITFIRNRFKTLDWSDLERLKTFLSRINSKNYPNASFGISVFEN